MLITSKVVEKSNKIRAKELGVKVLKGSKATRSNIGMHQLNPDAFELADALDTAERDGYRTIYIYDKRSWNKF